MRQAAAVFFSTQGGSPSSSSGGASLLQSTDISLSWHGQLAAMQQALACVAAAGLAELRAAAVGMPCSRAPCHAACTVSCRSGN